MSIPRCHAQGGTAGERDPLESGEQGLESTGVTPERKGDKVMDSSMVRILCTALAIAFLGVIVLRRKKGADE